MLKTRYSFLPVYLPTLILSGLWILIFRIKPHLGSDQNILLVFAMLGLTVITLFFILGLNYAAVLILEDDAIVAKSLFKTRRRNLGELKSVEPNNRDGRWLFSQTYSCLRFSFSDDSEWIMPKPFYRNMGPWLTALHGKVPGLFDPLSERTHAMPPVENVRYSARLLTCPSFIFSTLLAAGFTYFSIGHLHKFTFPAVVLTAYFFFAGWSLYYFELSGNELIVHNHLFRWFSRRIALDEIYEINTVTQSRRPKSLKVTTSGFSFYLYGSDVMYEEHWKKLLDDLRSAGIPCRE